MALPTSNVEDTPASAATVYTLGDALARPRASCVAGRTSGVGDCRTAGCSPGAKHETAARGRSRRPADGATRAGSRMGAAGWSALGGRCVGDVTHSRAGRRLSAVVVYPWEEVAAARPSWSLERARPLLPGSAEPVPPSSSSSSCSSLRPSRWSDICISLSRGFRGRVQTHTKSSLTHFRVLLKVLRGGIQFFPRDVIISRPRFNISSWLAV